MFDLLVIKESTGGVDIKNALDAILNYAGVSLNDLTGVSTDKAPAMLGKSVGLIGLLKSDSRFIRILLRLKMKNLINNERS